MTAAHLTCTGGTSFQLQALRTLSAEADPPSRRAIDVARVLSEAHAPVVLVLPSEDYKVLFMPGMPVPAEERNDALRWRLKDELEFPADEAVIDSVSAPVANQGHEHGLWFVVMARRKRVFDLVAPLSRTGARIEAVDVAEIAQRNLAMRSVAPGRTVALLCLDSQHALLTVSRDDAIYATRQFDPLAMALAGSDYERHQALLERLALELQRTFDNVERQYGAGPIDKVVLLTGPSHDDIGRVLTAHLPNKVESLSLSALMTSADTKLIEQAAASTTACIAIGAAMRAAEASE